ncbi:nicotinamide/nicotinic acid mononucleotide adenylyltransferase 3 isoform X2 [Teleopsis dalmanni]|uniref:nicotinamide/nicotinic acid mononucleotide adenylyltransferase 3 isoform X2 n=1 Tax=Teleopsis dalmanni TaxID=139649 RepID=UPI0018CD0BCD|nr:nicotinamide/nicotinic acid mononucleotide adenylyltransferase 3 isoform X2 [Teleopsis dalmanni]
MNLSIYVNKNFMLTWHHLFVAADVVMKSNKRYFALGRISSQQQKSTNMTTILDETIRKTCQLPRLVLIACGSFSPPTPMHMRMFEIARDYFEMQGTHQVLGGVISPTHDSYGKKGLATAVHRIAMVKLALRSSNWIRVSDWEMHQSKWSRTIEVLQYHQNYINNYINGGNDNNKLPGWLPNGLLDRCDRVQLRLLCGADLLESFATPGLWANEDIEDIVANHGLVVITRSGSNPDKFIFESDVLTQYQKNITLITNWVPNEVSSTMIRRLLWRGQSVKYILDELVEEYIRKNGLYNCKSINLDNRKATQVFCCGESDKTGKKLLLNRNGPGQAVQVITTERGVTDVVAEGEHLKSKKMKITAPQDV